MSKMQEYMQRGEENILKTYNRFPTVLERGDGVMCTEENVRADHTDIRLLMDHLGIYPVFGYVREGMDELYRLEKVPTRRVPFPIEGVEVNEPLQPEILEKVTLELFGKTYPLPVRMEKQELPPCWV